MVKINSRSAAPCAATNDMTVRRLGTKQESDINFNGFNRKNQLKNKPTSEEEFRTLGLFYLKILNKTKVINGLKIIIKKGTVPEMYN